MSQDASVLLSVVCPARKKLGWEGALVDNGFIKNMDFAHLRLYASQWDNIFFDGSTAVKLFRLEAHTVFFRLSMKRKLDVYLF